MSDTPTASIKRGSFALSPPEENESKKNKTEFEKVEMPEWADALGQSMQEVVNSMKSLESRLGDSIEFCHNGIENIKKEMENVVTLVRDVQAENNKLHSDIKQLKLQNAQLKERAIGQENYSRKENLIFKGVIERDGENCKEIINDLITKRLGLSRCDFARVHRLGKRNERKSRPIIVRFDRCSDRERVWEGRRKLKGTQIFVDEDFCQETVPSRQRLLPILTKARSLQKYRGNVRLVADKLFVNNVKYTAETMNTLPSDLNPVLSSTQTKNNVTAFFTESSPLSNFHRCLFVVDGQQYNCVEQYYQAGKAAFHNRTETKNQILSTDTPFVQMRIGKHLPTNDNWQEMAPKVMEKGFLAKFTQNESLKKLSCK